MQVLLLLLLQRSGGRGGREHLLLVSFLLVRLRLELMQPETFKLGFSQTSPYSLFKFRVKENRGWHSGMPEKLGKSSVCLVRG